MIRALLLVLITGAHLAAATDVTAVCPWVDPAAASPVMVQVTATEAVHLDLEARCGNHRARASWQLPPGRHHRCLLLPPIPNALTMELAWTRRDGDEGAKIPIPTLHDARTVCLVVDPTRALDVDQVDDFLDRHDRHGYRSWHGDRLDAGWLPDRWQAYPLDRQILLGPGGTLDDAVRRALADWTLLGGQLAVPASDAPTWRTLGARVSTYPDAEDPVQVTPALAVPVDEDSYEYDPDRIRVPGTGDIPAALFILLALGFVVVAGPLNFWWTVIRLRRRHLLLITVPAVSLVACVVLLTLNLLAEGLEVRTRIDSLTWLDGQHHRAARWQGTTYYAPFGISTCTLDLDSELILLRPATAHRFSYHRRRRRYRDPPSGPWRVDWTGAQRLTGPVAPTRRNHRVVFSRVGPERMRLHLQRDEAGRYLLTNGLDVALTSVSWRAADGQVYGVDNLAPGAKAVLKTRERMLPIQIHALGPGAEQRWQTTATQSGHVRALLAAPLGTLMGPTGICAAAHHLLAGPLALEDGA